MNWASIRLILAIAKIHGLFSKSIDFVLGFPQADLDVPVYMKLPIGFDDPNSENCKFYVLRLNKSLYGLKQAGYNWFAKLSNGLQNCRFVQSNIDPCVFFATATATAATTMTATATALATTIAIALATALASALATALAITLALATTLTIATATAITLTHYSAATAALATAVVVHHNHDHQS